MSIVLEKTSLGFDPVIRDSNSAEVFADIMKEMESAINKHPLWPVDNVYRAAIISEEAGEVTRAANQIYEGNGTVNELYNEVIQTAGTCIRMALFLKQDKINNE